MATLLLDPCLSVPLLRLCCCTATLLEYLRRECACGVVSYRCMSSVLVAGVRGATGLLMLLQLVRSIYKKALVLSNDERSGRATGDIVNLQSTDATRVGDWCTYGQVAWSGLFQITLAFISLYQLLGWTMLVGVAVMVISMPLTAAIAR